MTAVSIDAALDPDYALAWRDAVEDAVHEAAGDQAEELLDSMRFLERLDPLADLDPEHPTFAPLVERAVEAHLAEAGERVTESVTVEDRIAGRLLEARGSAVDGGRVYRVQIIATGDSRNGRRYPANVLEKATRLYEGAKAYDRHRTPQELQSSTITGLVGHYRNVEATTEGLFGDLHLLPGATHTAEALDASIANQAAGLPPLVGISHDALTELRPIHVGGKRMQEAVRITRVHSADVVADPAAGGKATRVLAGGIDPHNTHETDPALAGESNEEDGVTVTSEAVLAALQTIPDEQLAAVGLSRTVEATEHDTSRDTGAVQALDKDSFLGRLMVQQKATEAHIPDAVVAEMTKALPERITESDVDAHISSLKAMLGMVERAGLAPTMTVQVTKEAREKKAEALDGFFAGNGKGYVSFRGAFLDWTGARPQAFDEDFSRRILRESIGNHYDSAVRSTESLDSTSWAQALGDSITRQMLADYARPDLQSWRRIVSRTPAITDFRTQRRVRLGGYGVLPTVNQGQPYQPLTSPGDEEATYAVIKRGGTDDLTFEMIANDDVGTIQQIPVRLGRAAAITLFRFVWDILKDNATCTYDSTALFHADHTNTDTSAALTDTTLATGRRKMREQAAFGQATDILSLTPRILVVPPELEYTGFQLTTSAVQITSNADATIPNLHRGLDLIIVDYFTDANDWFLIADPSMVPTIEVGFYQGRQEPELFTQSDPSQGSMFSADKLTWKIRHIYSGTPLDHRGFYRGQG